MGASPLHVPIRRAWPSDAEELISLVAESFAEENRLLGVDPERAAGHVRGALYEAAPPMSLALRAGGCVSELWVATGGGRIVGSYALSGRRPLTISNVAVRPRLRGMGIGRRLMEHALGRARALGRRVVLSVLAENAPALALYAAVGMRPYDRRRSYTARLSDAQAGVAAPACAVRLVPVGRVREEDWRRVLAASVPPEALALESLYRNAYIGRAAGRWWDEHASPVRTVRRALLLGGEVVGVLCARARPDSHAAEIHAPLYLPGAAPHLADALRAAAAWVGRGDRSLTRLYVPERRPEAHAAAEALGYRPECAWVYLSAE